jgi:hypothetical protein
MVAVKSLQDAGILSPNFYTDNMGYPMVRSETAMVSTKATSTNYVTLFNEKLSLKPVFKGQNHGNFESWVVFAFSKNKITEKLGTIELMLANQRVTITK